MEAIEIKNITKNFSNVQALKDITIQFEKGKITGLIGRNGAGKTTLLNIITSRLQATKGTVTTNGLQSYENDDAMGKIFFMSVSNFYPSDMNVKEAVKAGKLLMETFDHKEALAYLKLFEIPLRRKIVKLSTGMQSLFKLSMALASNAEYLLLDEPVLGLDANNRELAYRLIIEKQQQNGCGVVLSTHLIEEISKIIEDVYVIHKGTILIESNVDDLLSRFFILSGPKEQVDALASQHQVISRKELAGITSVGISGNIIAKEDLPSGVTLTRYPLQQLFVDLTNTNGIEREVLQ